VGDSEDLLRDCHCLQRKFDKKEQNSNFATIEQTKLFD